MKNTQDKQTVLTRWELAEVLDIPVRNINDMRKAGKIPSLELSKKNHCYVLEDVIDALKRGSI